MHHLHVEFGPAEWRVVEVSDVVEEEAVGAGVRRDDGLGEGEVLVVVKNFFVDGRGAVSDGCAGDALLLDVVEAEEAAVQLFGRGRGELGAVGGDELDADLIQVQRRVAVIGNDEADGQDAVTAVVEPEEVALFASVEWLGGYGDVLFLVRFVRDVGRGGEDGWRFFFSCESRCGECQQQRNGEPFLWDLRHIWVDAWFTAQLRRALRHYETPWQTG